MHVIPLALLLSLALPQDPGGSAHADLEALAARLDTAHRPRGPVPPVTAFRSNLELHVLDAEAKEGGQVDLAVQFLQWQRPGSDRVQPLIRYEVLEAGAPIVRGRDKNGPWQLFQGEARDLRGADFGADLAECQRHTNLARQLLRFLDPGKVLRSLERPSGVSEEQVRIGTERNTKTACLCVEGFLPAFPLLQEGGDDAPVKLKAYVTKTEGRLLAIEAWPLRDGTADEARMERVHLLDLHERDDLLVPRKIEHLFRKADGRLRLQSRAVLTTLSLRPELRVEDFDRPKT